MKSFYATFIDIWRFFSGHTATGEREVPNVNVGTMCPKYVPRYLLNKHIQVTHQVSARWQAELLIVEVPGELQLGRRPCG